MGISYLVYSKLVGNIALPIVVIMTTMAAFFVMASQGATFAIVPLLSGE